MVRKACFVPSCSNTNENAPEKIFLKIPSSNKKRDRWCDAVKAKTTEKVITSAGYCCEDHFDLKADAHNWIFFETIGGPLRLKPNIVPHKFLEAPPPVPQESALSSAARKRKMENLETFQAGRGPGVLSPERTMSVNCPRIIAVSPATIFSLSQVPNPAATLEKSCGKTSMSIGIQTEDMKITKETCIEKQYITADFASSPMKDEE